MLRRHVISVACIQITGARPGRGAWCYERLVRVTNGSPDDRKGSAARRATEAGGSAHLVIQSSSSPNAAFRRNTNRWCYAFREERGQVVVRSHPGSVHSRSRNGMPSVRARIVQLVLLLGCAADLRAQSRGAALHGIRFTVDTLETPIAWRGELSRLAGTVEFGGGRGRFSVTAVRGGPPVAMNGVIVRAPLAQRADYYLFDSTG